MLKGRRAAYRSTIGHAAVRDSATDLGPKRNHLRNVGGRQAFTTRQARLEPVEMITVAIARTLGEPQPGQAAEQNGQRNFHFEPRKRRADAKVDATAERDMRIGRPRSVDQVGIGETLRIAIGGAQ